MATLDTQMPIEDRLASIDEKLSRITAELDEQRRLARERKELMDDLNIVGKDLFQNAVVELDQVAPYFDASDLTHLFKRLLRNVRTINWLLDKLESSVDLVKDASPLTTQAFNEILDTMDNLDQRGYFEFLREAGRLVDTVVTQFSVEDVRMLRENIVTILLTVKHITQPEMLATVNNAVNFYEKMDVTVGENVSLPTLLKEMNDPNTRRGMLFMIRFLKNLAGPEDASNK